MLIDSFIQYLKFEKRYSAHTIKSYSGDLTQFYHYIEENYGSESLQAITHQMVRSWMAVLIEDHTARSVNRKISALKTYFKFLVRKGAVSENPMQKVVAPKTSGKLPVFVEDNNMRQMFEIVDFGDGYKGSRDQLIIEILYATGMRKSELINLKITDIDVARHLIKVLGKGNKERLIPIDGSMVSRINEYLDERENEFANRAEPYLLLTDKGKKLYPKFPYKVVHRFLSQITTLEKRSPHVLRHSFATHLLNNGAELNAIKELLGHANLAATQIYTHNSIEQLKTIYKKAHPKA